MLEIKNLCKSYETVVAVSNLSFQVETGELLVLLGTSGCGKTTTLKMINRLISPDQGEILLNGENLLELDPILLRRRIGYVIQSVGLFPHYSVFENVAVVPRLMNWEEEQIKLRCEELLEMVGLPGHEFATRYPHELSGGQRQRVGFARALAAKPDLLLLDEPFAALDPITRTAMCAELQNLPEVKSKHKVMVTHDVIEAFEMGDKILLLDAGNVQQYGSPEELLFLPQNSFVRDFLAESRFDLELRVVRIHDLLPHLKLSEQAKKESSVPCFNGNPSVLKVIKTLDRENHAQATLEVNSGHVKFSSDELLSAFSLAKKSIINKLRESQAS